MRSSSYLEIRQALRVLTKSLSFSVPAVIALAIGIGANVAAYSIVYSILVRPLPYRNANRLVHIARAEGSAEFKVSALDFEILRVQQGIWEDMALYQQWYVSFNGSAGPEMLRSANVSTNFFDVFEVPPALGRSFYPEEDQAGREMVAVISDSTWRKRFAGDANIVGKQFTFGAKSYSIVGVAPEKFSFPEADIWFPLLKKQGSTDGDKDIIARIVAGRRISEARAATEVAGKRLSSTEGVRLRSRFSVVPLQEYLNREVHSLAFLLFATSGFVLLLACTNVSLALISRSIARTGEIAVRQALGARAHHLMQHVLTESIVIGLLGGALGTATAWGVTGIIRATMGQAVEGINIGLNHETVIFALLISLLAGTIAGLLPAALSTRREIFRRLAQVGSTVQPATGKLRVRDIMLAFQISAALCLLICTALMLHSIRILSRVDVGFDFHQVLVSWTVPPPSYTQDQVKLLYRQALEAVQAIPGVKEAGVTNNGFFFGIHAGAGVVPAANVASASRWVEVRSVSPGLFQAAGMRLIQGRYFSDADAAIPSPGKLVVDETFAQRFWPGQNALGKMVTIPGKPATDWQVIGVITATRDISLRDEPVPTIYRDYRQDNVRSMCLVIRAALDQHSLAKMMRERIASIDSNTPPSPVLMLEDLQAGPLQTARIEGLVLGFFAAIALALAATGIYGAVSYVVVQRTREIGVRIALGADRSKILRLTTAHAMKITFAGLACGIVGTFLLTGMLSGNISYFVRPDTVSYLAASLLLATTAFIAAYIPARKAIELDPMICLRCE